MDTWMKGAIIGGIWGTASLITQSAGFPANTSAPISALYWILMVPVRALMSVGDKIYGDGAALLIAAPVVWAAAGAAAGLVYGKYSG